MADDSSVSASVPAPRPQRRAAAQRRSAPQGRPGRQLGRLDLRVLAFAAEHRFVLNAHVRTLLGVSSGSASARLRALTRGGYLRFDRKLAGPGSYQIATHGLRAIGSSRPRPAEIDLATYDHEVGLGWLWLAACRGALGPLRGMASERFMRSEDRLREDPSERFGVRLGGVGPYGGERRHYPDLLLETDAGQRVAVELELTPKGRRRRHEILGGYALDGRIDAVLYLVENERTALAIERAARHAGIGDRVHVHLAHFGPGSGAIGAGRGAERVARSRGAERAATRHGVRQPATSRGPERPAAGREAARPVSGRAGPEAGR